MKQTVVIRLVDDIHALCFPKQINLFVNDTIEYVSEDPKLPFKIVFDGSPFSIPPALEITDSNPRALLVPGRFFFKCFLRREDGIEVGWFPGEDPESGADVDVRPRTPGT